MHSKPALVTAAKSTSRAAGEQRGLGLMVAGGLLLGTLGVFVQEAAQHPLVTVWFRCALGALALFLWCAATGNLRGLHLQGRRLGVVCVMGCLMVLNWALFFAAIPRTSMAVATVVFHIQPIWVIVFGALFLRERVFGRIVTEHERTVHTYLQITGYTSPTQVTCDVVSQLPDNAVLVANASTRWAFGAWSDIEGWPSQVTFFKERLIFGSLTAENRDTRYYHNFQIL